MCGCVTTRLSENIMLKLYRINGEICRQSDVHQRKRYSIRFVHNFFADECEKSNSIVTYTPTIDCVLKLGQFESQLQITTCSGTSEISVDTS